jgi:hypothetical protein
VLAAEMDAMRENALTAALAEARASLAALQRQHEAGQNSLAELQVRRARVSGGSLVRRVWRADLFEGVQFCPG